MPVPPVAELLSSLRVVALPMRVRFRGIVLREAALFEGPHGWAEFSPFVEYGDAEAANWLAAAIQYGWEHLPEPRRARIPVNATMPAVAPADVARVLGMFTASSVTERASLGSSEPEPLTVKVKVAAESDSLTDDVARVRAVRASVPPGTRIRVDANGRWALEVAKRALDALAEFDLEYAEQPVATLTDLAALRAWSHSAGPGTPIAADESIRKTDDPLRVARMGAADLIVVKVQPLGGIRRALDVVADSGLPAVVSSALDTAVGIAAGAALAARLPSLPYACGLGTTGFFEHDVIARPANWSPLVLHDGRVQPTVATLTALRAPADREQWWRERVRRCHALLDTA